MKPFIPYTREEINAILPKMEREIRATEEDVGCKPIGPLTMDEAMDYLLRLGGIAEARPWTREEAFMHGQLLNVYAQAVRADTLGYKGRWMVVSEDALQKELKRHA